MTEHDCIGIQPKVDDLNRAINKEGETSEDNKWWLDYYHCRLQERHNILIRNRDHEIAVLKKRIKELEKYEPKNKPEKIDISLTYNKLGKRIYLNWISNSTKRDSMFDECGRKWFIPKLNDDSYIKIRFIGRNLDKQEQTNENEGVHLRGLSSSSAIIGNTVMGRGKLKDIKNGFVIDKRTLKLLLIDSSVWMYALHGTESIEILGSSEDINATSKII